MFRKSGKLLELTLVRASSLAENWSLAWDNVAGMACFVISVCRAPINKQTSNQTNTPAVSSPRSLHRLDGQRDVQPNGMDVHTALCMV